MRSTIWWTVPESNRCPTHAKGMYYRYTNGPSVALYCNSAIYSISGFRREIKKICYNYLMKLKHYPEGKLRNEILEILGRHLNLSQYKVFYFGSRVTGRASDRADIDLGIKGDQPIPIEILGQLREEIENLPTLYSVDLVDFSSVSDNFREVAMKKVEYIN